MTLFMNTLFVVGTLGSIHLARKYTGRMAKVLLTITGAISLWTVLMSSYAQTIASPVPELLSFAVFPVVAFIVMTIIIQKVPKIDSKEKRKVKE